ncbi:MAG: pantetheine-phosphate adenylyltransferase, partial [Chlamydiales bacterium]
QTFSSKELENLKTAIYPGYFYRFDDLGIDVIRESLKIYDRIVLLALKQEDRLPDATLQTVIDRVDQIAQNHLDPVEFARIKVLGVTKRERIAHFLKATKISGMLRKFHRVESEGKLEAESETSRINYEEYGLQTIFVIPAYSYLELPDDQESKVMEENYRRLVTDVLRAKFKESPAYPQTLSREQFEKLIEGTSVFQILGKELPTIDANVALYAGSFDPLTNGHLEVLRQASSVYREVVIAIAVNPDKSPLFFVKERKELVEESLRSIGVTNVKVVAYDTIVPTVRIAGDYGAGTLLRGARNVKDIKDELVLAWINQILNPKIRTVLFTPHEYKDISSTRLKAEYQAGHSIAELAPGPVYAELNKTRFKEIRRDARLIGLVGGIASGKSTVLKELQRNRNTETVDLDKLAHQVLRKAEVISRLSKLFGPNILTDNRVDRIKLRAIVFNNDRSRFLLNSIVSSYVFSDTERLIREIMLNKPSTHLILLEGFGIVESGLYRLMDEIWYVDAPEDLRAARALTDKSRIALNRETIADIIETQKSILEASKSKARVVLDNSKDYDFLKNQVEKRVAIENLRSKWKQVMAMVAVEDSDDVIFSRITGKYTEPHRYYHDVTHIDSLFRLFDELVEPDGVEGLLKDAGKNEIAAFRLAIFFHDVVYNAVPCIDEDQSIELTEQALSTLRIDRSIIDRTKFLIELTKTHQADSSDIIAQIFMDLDLAILGEREEVFAKYERNIRKEYKRYPFALYIEGRKRILEGLEQADLFRHPKMKARFAEKARQNLRRSLDFLSRIDADLV